MPLRLLEHYPSIQGEGPRTGVPTQFVRFAGCNLRCAEWPCDTQFAIQPKLYRKEQKFVSVASLYADIAKMSGETGAENVCLTGGEPMIQRADDITELIETLTFYHTPVEMFSNGTLPYPDAIIELCQVVMDWKLPGSGEDATDPTRIANYHAMREAGGHTIKFTCANRADLEHALHLYKFYDMEDFPGQVYVGPVWDAQLPPRQIVKFVLEHHLAWNLNVQLHKFIWEPDARRT